MSLQLPAILSPPTPCIPSPALTVSPLEEVAKVALPFTGRRPVLGFAHPTQARQCIRPYRVQHCLRAAAKKSGKSGGLQNRIKKAAGFVARTHRFLAVRFRYGFSSGSWNLQ